MASTYPGFPRNRAGERSGGAGLREVWLCRALDKRRPAHLVSLLEPTGSRNSQVVDLACERT